MSNLKPSPQPYGVPVTNLTLLYRTSSCIFYNFSSCHLPHWPDSPHIVQSLGFQNLNCFGDWTIANVRASHLCCRIPQFHIIFPGRIVGADLWQTCILLPALVLAEVAKQVIARLYDINGPCWMLETIGHPLLDPRT